uniref:Uncharacterized protein n=1 Tax=Rhizophora mucronata TaxID=61149 RepID=A0A2P2ITQ1_RHIMU
MFQYMRPPHLWGWGRVDVCSFPFDFAKRLFPKFEPVTNP